MNTTFIDKVKLLFKGDKELRRQIYDLLGVYPRNIELYKVAFAHRSRQYKNRNGKQLNNERLEFLGDAVLETIVSDILFHRFEKKREGFLTNARSSLVKRSTLNKVAEEMGLVEMLQLPKQPNMKHCNIGGNALEALIGAIYLDRGYVECFKFVEERLLHKYINLEAVVKKEENFKSKLLEWTQKNKLKAQFNLKTPKKKGEKTEENPGFRTVVLIEGVFVGEGFAATKRESQQRAAKVGLDKMRKDKKLKDKVFSAKEKRTKMEAPQYAALPKENEHKAPLVKSEQDVEKKEG